MKSNRRAPRQRLLRPTLAVAATLLLSALAPAAAQLDADDADYLRQGYGIVPGSGQLDDRMGTALAAGDFDHDGARDLAIGVPGETVGIDDNAGRVIVIYGALAGLAAGTAESWAADDFAGLGFAADSGDRFGSALAVGDFDGDYYDDLAISAPFLLVTRADMSEHDAAGGVFVLYGSSGGLTTTGAQVWRQGHDGLEGVAEADDRLGEVLAAGDLNDDGYDDLAIGVPYEDVGATVDAGGVNVVYGSEMGLTTFYQADPVWTQGVLGGADQEGDRFGSALAVGDFFGDGAADLAIGAPWEDLTGAPDGGFLTVVRGLDVVGLTASEPDLFTQGLLAFPGSFDEGERFSAALAAGDFDGDGYDDLAIGSPGETWTDPEEVDHPVVGVVDILRGHPTDGLSGYLLSSRIERVETGPPLDYDEFGGVLAAGDFDGDGGDELVVGVPNAEVGGHDGAGAAYVISRPTQSPFFSSLMLSQDSAAPDYPIAYESFGAALAVGDFDSSRYSDLAVGVPDEDLAAIGNAGAVNAFYSFTVFRDDFESGYTAKWSDSVGD